MVWPSLAGVDEAASLRVAGQTAEEYLVKAPIAPGDHVLDGIAPNAMPGAEGVMLAETQWADLVAFLLTLRSSFCISVAQMFPAIRRGCTASRSS